MSSQGPFAPGGVADMLDAGNAWTNVTNAAGTSGYATVSNEFVSNILRSTEFGFSIGSDSTPATFAASFWRKSDQTGEKESTDATIDITLSGDVRGSNLASGTAWPRTASVATYNPGNIRGSAIPTGASVDDSTFGFDITVDGGGSGASDNNYVNTVLMSVTYTASAGGSTAAPAALLARMPFIFLAGAWLPFTIELARSLPRGIYLFKQTRRPGRVVSVPCRSRLVLPKLILPKRFQVDRPARVLAQ